MELIFSLAAGTVVWFEFRARKILILNGCFSWCWAVLTAIEGFSVSHALPASRTEGAEREHGQDSDLNTECHGLHRNWEGWWLGAADCCLGMGWGQWLVSNYPVHHCFFLGFISFPFFWFPYHHDHYISITKLFLSQPRLLPFSPVLLLIPLGGRVRGCMVPSCQLGLKYTSPSTSSNSLLPVSWLLLQPIWSPFSVCSIFPIPFAPESLLLKL